MALSGVSVGGGVWDDLLGVGNWNEWWGVGSWDDSAENCFHRSRVFGEWDCSEWVLDCLLVVVREPASVESVVVGLRGPGSEHVTRCSSIVPVVRTALRRVASDDVSSSSWLWGFNSRVVVSGRSSSWGDDGSVNISSTGCSSAMSHREGEEASVHTSWMANVDVSSSDNADCVPPDCLSYLS